MKKLMITLTLVLGIVSATSAQYENTKIQVGQSAPDLALSTPEGKTLRLSEINKGRYILLDFWASWCGPCRRANPAVVSMYKEYSGKKFKGAKNGFTVVSVSMDKNKEAWINAIKADNLNWPYHMSDLVDWNTGKCVPANTYGIQFIPQSFLIDPQGKIMGKYQVVEEAEKEIKKLARD